MVEKTFDTDRALETSLSIGQDKIPVYIIPKEPSNPQWHKLMSFVKPQVVDVSICTGEGHQRK